jgi:hypothetical protein
MKRKPTTVFDVKISSGDRTEIINYIKDKK